MTPKEKAEELFNKMNGFRISYSHRVKCAKVCVDEIMKSIGWEHLELDGHANYWEQVKTELDKFKKK